MLVKELFEAAPGYHPFLITKYWQVAQLNYSKEQDAEEIRELEAHFHTDETFTLLKGSAFLIAQKDGDKSMEMNWMKLGKTYNVPAKIWHNVAMQKGSSILITENAQTHIEEKKLLPLSVDAQKRIAAFLKQEV